MEVTSVELVRSAEPVALPEPWRPAWREPNVEPVTELEWSVIRVHTDEGITGIGPGVGDPAEFDLAGYDPTRVGEFWERYLGGRRSRNAGNGAAGLEIALWDALGKAAGMPIHELLGATADRLPVYAATCRILDPADLADTVLEIKERGFRAIKLRLHRGNPADDLAAVRAVREAVGDDYTLFVDANQNNTSEGYDFWSQRTALRVARELDDLGVEFLEEPRPRRDVDGLAEISEAVDMAVAGGEHSVTPHDFRPHLRRGAYDILQPDVMLGGNMGITGIRRTAIVADLFERTVIPHVLSGGNFPIGLAATLQAVATVGNCPMVEFPFDPPVLTEATNQAIAEDPFRIDSDGCVEVPDGPGLGIELDGDQLESNSEVVWSSA
jgi:L-alanine-DL-glutamate epimerase-like enolase superfamily enzyme